MADKTRAGPFKKPGGFGANLSDFLLIERDFLLDRLAFNIQSVFPQSDDFGIQQRVSLVMMPCRFFFSIHDKLFNAIPFSTRQSGNCNHSIFVNHPVKSHHRHNPAT